MALTAETVLLERRFSASAEALKPIRDAVREHSQRAGCSEAEASDIVHAIDEACQNIIRHAYCGDEDGVIDLRLEQRGAELVVSLRDHAPPSDPECLERLRNLDEVRPGGLGTHLMKSLMDEVGFVEIPEGAGNLLRMIKRIKRAKD
jgi:sigma-B regulation protein RsbU (phosphoserine phosphatase)